MPRIETSSDGCFTSRLFIAIVKSYRSSLYQLKYRNGPAKGKPSYKQACSS